MPAGRNAVTKKKKRGLQAKTELSDQSRAAARAWLEGDITDAAAALAALTELAQADPAAAEAAVTGLGRLETAEAADLARLLGDQAPTKALRKLARKAAYSLQTKGFTPAEPQRSRPVYKQAESDPAQGYLCGYLADGHQLILFALPGPDGRYVGAAMVDYRVGLRELSLARMGLAKFKEMVAEATRELTLPPVAVPEDDLAWVLNNALEATRASGRAISGDASVINDWLARWAERIASPPIYSRLEIDPDRRPDERQLKEFENLMDEPPLTAWLIDFQDWSRVREQVATASSSSLVLSGAQSAVKLDEALAEAGTELFTPDERAAWQRRLEETAVRWAAEDRIDSATAVLTALSGLDDPDHPLFKVLLNRAWQAEQALAEQGHPAGPAAEPEAEPTDSNDEGGGLILPPGVKS